MRRVLAVAGIVGATIVFRGPSLPTQQTPHHEFAVAARRYAFEPATLEVHQGDLIRITLHTEDIPHSFVVDALRVARRVTPDHAVTLEMSPIKRVSFRSTVASRWKMVAVTCGDGWWSAPRPASMGRPGGHPQAKTPADREIFRSHGV